MSFYLTKLKFIDQNPIGKLSRSNPATYIKVYDDIRKLFARQPLAETRKYKIGFFSFCIDGGEAQRIKLASFLGKGNTPEKTLFIFDEPTTGLHFHDINKLLNSFYALIKKGHSILCIEHNLDVIKCADWIIDLGPEGGDKGGKIVFEGTPEEIIKCKKSITGHFLKKKI